MTASNEKCFACGKAFRGGRKFLVDTRDDQKVYVGPECYRKVMAAGDEGYSPFGPTYVRLYPMTKDHRCK